MKKFIVGLLLLLASLGAHAQTANLWIDTDGGTCTRQGTAAAYVDAAACTSMDVAINACTPGDIIRMKAGTYSGQIINQIKTEPGCTIIAEASTTLTGEIHTHGAWYEIQNIDAAGWSLDNTTGGPGTNNITCRECRFEGNNGLYWVAANHDTIRWIGGSFRNFSCATCAQGFAIFSGEAPAGTTTATNDLVDGVLFDTIQNTGGVENHFEVIRIDGVVTGLTVRNSTFTNNVASSGVVLMSTLRGVKPQNITWENNFIEQASPASVIFNMNFQELGICEDWTFRYNTIIGGASLLNSPLDDNVGGNCNDTFSDVVWVGNIGPNLFGLCQGNSWTSNVWFGSGGPNTCDASDTNVTEASLNFDTDGFHITSGSSAIGAGGSGADCIATDIDGNSRTSPCDAGAHQLTAGEPPPEPGGGFSSMRNAFWLFLSISLAWLLTRRRKNASYPGSFGGGFNPAFSRTTHQMG